MIEHLTHNTIDKAWWDAQLLRCSNKLWYAQSWVLDIASPGWEALVDRHSGSIMPLTWRKKFGINYLYQPYGIQQLGLFAPTIRPGLQEEFLAVVPKRFKYWDFQLNTAIRMVNFPDLITEPRIDQELLLNVSSEQIRSSYSENHRRNLRKAASAADHITEHVTPAEFVSLFEKTTGARFANTDPRDMRVLHNLITEGMERGEIAIIGMRKDGLLHAAVSMIRWQGRVIWFKAAADEIGHLLKAMFFLVDQVISQHAGKEQVLDFAGSNSPSVARFNEGFGARSTVYLRLKRNTLPLPIKWFKK